ncbi:MAG: aminodeoxychorismate lyase [Halioglobus sp.]
MSTTPVIWVDGEPALSLPLPDRGLDFGDGVFETLLVRDGVPLFLSLHLERLSAGLTLLSFPDCLGQAKAQLSACAAELGDSQWAALRLTVTRGSGPRGYASPKNATPRIVITAAALDQDRSRFAAPLELGWADLRWSSQPHLAGIKHLNRLEQVIVANQAKEAGWDEAVVLDQLGNVCSLSAGNLFILEAGKLLTPPLETCGIAGTRRRLVLEQLAPSLCVEVEQVPISTKQLMAAEAVIGCNSIRGLQPVARIDERTWTDFSMCEALHKRYIEAMS